MPKAPLAPWAFRDFGNGLQLVADHGQREVVLGVAPAGPNKGRLVARDESGRLVQLTTDHPVAKLIELAPAGFELAQEIVDYFGDFEIDPLLTTDIKLREMARSILKAV